MANVVESAADAIVCGHLDGTITSWNAAAERLYGYKAEEIIGRSFMRLVPWEDLPRSKALQANVTEGKPVPEITTRAVRKDGSEVDVSLSISPLVDDAGALVGAVVIGRDITRRKQINAQRREAEQRFAGAFDNAPIGMALVSTEGTFLDINRSFCEFVGREADELRSLTFQDITHPEDLQMDLEKLDDLIAGRISQYEMEKRYLLPDGIPVWGQLCVSLVRDENGAPHHFVSQVKDINGVKEQDLELRRLAGHLRDLSLHDPLTGLGNQRAFAQDVDAALARAAARRDGIALVLVDLIDLKAHNLAHGRVSGDRELVEVARVLEVADDDASPFRIGGHEFAVLLEGADMNAGERCAKRIERAIADGPVGVTATSAVVVSPLDGTTRAELLDSADLTLRAFERRADHLPLPTTSTATGSPGPSELIVGTICARLDLAAACLTDGDGDVASIVAGDASEIGLRVGEPASRADAFSVGSVPIGESGTKPTATIHCFSREERAPLDERQRELARFAGALAAQALTREAAEALQRTAEMELSGVAALVAALEARDHYTAEHSRRVVELAGSVARRLSLDAATTATVERVAVLHDIGKVAVPDSVLLKRGKLTPSEWELMHQHPAVGERIVASTQTLAHLAAPIRAEHERWDGDGYPDGLRGEEIPVASRITLACDAYHAMTSERPYRAAMDEAEARAELRANAGSQFDPTVVRALLEELASDAGRVDL